MEDKKMTIDDIARALGVSKTTVSRAMSGKGRIGEATRQRVLAYVAEHNYSPNVIAKGLAQSKTYNIGMVLPGDYHIAELPFFQKCMLGISRKASAAGYDVLISMVTKEDISQLERVVTNGKVDGVILTRTMADDAPMRLLADSGVPFVAIGSTNDDGVVQIDNDHLNACTELTARILAQGVSRIALIGGDRDLIVTKTRLQGFKAALADRNGRAGGSGPDSRRIDPDNSRKDSRPADEDGIWMGVEDSREVEGIVSQLLDTGTECIVCMDDHLCDLVLDTLQQRQIEVPGQMRVASFYDSALLANRMIPVTSIRFDVEELGTQACGLLLRMLDGEEVVPRTLLGYEVCMRRSTG